VTVGGLTVSLVDVRVSLGSGNVKITPALVPTQSRSRNASRAVTRRQAILCCRMMSSATEKSKNNRKFNRKLTENFNKSFNIKLNKIAHWPFVTIIRRQIRWKISVERKTNLTGSNWTDLAVSERQPVRRWRRAAGRRWSNGTVAPESFPERTATRRDQTNSCTEHHVSTRRNSLPQT